MEPSFCEQPLTNFAKKLHLNVWRNSGYASAFLWQISCHWSLSIPPETSENLWLSANFQVVWKETNTSLVKMFQLWLKRARNYSENSRFDLRKTTFILLFFCLNSAWKETCTGYVLMLDKYWCFHSGYWFYCDFIKLTG